MVWKDCSALLKGLSPTFGFLLIYTVLGQAEELSTLTTRFNKDAKNIDMRISAEIEELSHENKIQRWMACINSMESIDGEKLKTMNQLEYIEATITEYARQVQVIKLRIVAIVESSLSTPKAIGETRTYPRKQNKLTSKIITLVWIKNGHITPILINPRWLPARYRIQ